MTPPSLQIPFQLSQDFILKALSAHMRKLFQEDKLPEVLPLLLTNSRPPKGLTTTLELAQPFADDAVLAYAQQLVAPAFTYFSVDFANTKGDGVVANIIASTTPFEAGQERAPEPKEAPAPQPTKTADPEPAKEPEAPAEEPAQEPEPEPKPEAVTEDTKPEGEGLGLFAPAETEEDPTKVPTAGSLFEAALAPEDRVEPVEGSIFGDLARPNNSVTAG